jgi:hypothetical protein
MKEFHEREFYESEPLISLTLPANSQTLLHV